MKISKFYSGNLADVMYNLGSLKSLDNRCTGKTLGKALECLGKLLQHPGDLIQTECQEVTADVKILIATLRLKFIERVGRDTFLYKPYIEEDDIHRELLDFKRH